MEIMLAQRLAHAHAVDGEHTAKVALDEHADGVPAECFGQLSAAGSDAALPAEGHGAGAGADRSLGHWP